MGQISSRIGGQSLITSCRNSESGQKSERYKKMRNLEKAIATAVEAYLEKFGSLTAKSARHFALVGRESCSRRKGHLADRDSLQSWEFLSKIYVFFDV